MSRAVKHWYGVFRPELMGPIRSYLLALLKGFAGDKR